MIHLICHDQLASNVRESDYMDNILRQHTQSIYALYFILKAKMVNENIAYSHHYDRTHRIWWIHLNIYMCTQPDIND